MLWVERGHEDFAWVVRLEVVLCEVLLGGSGGRGRGTVMLGWKVRRGARGGAQVCDSVKRVFIGREILFFYVFVSFVSGRNAWL